MAFKELDAINFSKYNSIDRIENKSEPQSRIGES
jgi:hypothetical protein